MKTHRKVVVLHTSGRRGFLDLTREVEAALLESGIQEGFCLVHALDTTASVLVAEDESGLRSDLTEWLDGLAPFSPGADPGKGGYLHNLTGDENGDAHLKRLLAGRGVMLAITAGRPELGPMERVLYAEFDGQRNKGVLLKLLGT